MRAYVYIRKGTSYDRATQPTGDELKARKGNLSQISDDQDNFLVQKDTAGGKKTMRAYLWLVCGAEYDQQHQG